MQSKIIETDQERRSFIETARRAQIIDCAIQVIAELGYGQASLAQIAKRAGISTGVISYYFAGKDDLIAEVVAHVYAAGDAEIRPQVLAQTTASDMLATFIRANIAFAAANPGYVTAMVEIRVAARAARAAPPFDPASAQVRFDGLSRILEFGQGAGLFRAFCIPIMADLILEAIDLRAFRPDLEPQALASELVTVFDLATRAARPA